MMTDNLHTSIFDEELIKQVSHYQNIYQLMPFIGKEWGNQKKKILLVAESHYLPPKSQIKNTAVTWYSLDASILSPTENKYLNTRLVIKQFVENKSSRAYTIFRNLKSVLNLSDSLEDFAYCNYFQRPAEKTGDSINVHEIDESIAYKTLVSIATITQPDAIIFCSKKAYRSFWKMNGANKRRYNKKN